jgi:hypothetical protein
MLLSLTGSNGTKIPSPPTARRKSQEKQSFALPNKIVVLKLRNAI